MKKQSLAQGAIQKNSDLRAAEKRPQGIRRVAVNVVAGIGLVWLAAFGTQSTFAYFNDREEIPAVTITAGSLDVKVNQQRVADVGAGPVTPAAPFSKVFDISNAGTTPAQVDAKAVLQAGGDANGLAKYAVLEVKILAATNRDAALTECAAVQVTDASPAFLGFTKENLTVVRPGVPQFACLKLGLRSDTPVTESGPSIPFLLNIAGRQVQQ